MRSRPVTYDTPEPQTPRAPVWSGSFLRVRLRFLAAVAGMPPVVNVAYLSSRLGLLLVGWIGLQFFPPPWESAIDWLAFRDYLWLDGWARLDSGWYLSVSEGYSFREGAQSNVAFFPLFPLLAGAISLPLRLVVGPVQAFFFSGIALSYAAFFTACLGVYRLGRATLGSDEAGRAVWLLCLFPSSFFFSAAYAESLYLALAVWAFYCAHRGHWVPACALAGLCAVMRVPGFIVGLALMLEYLSQVGWRWGKIRRDSLAFLLVPSMLFALLWYFWLAFGHPLIFLDAYSAWGRTRPDALWTDVVSAFNPDTDLIVRLILTLELALLVAAVPLVVLAWRRLGPGYGFFPLASIAIGAGTGLGSEGRHLAVLFPLFFAVALVTRRRSVFAPVAIGSALLLGVFAYLFTTGFPVT